MVKEVVIVKCISKGLSNLQHVVSLGLVLQDSE